MMRYLILYFIFFISASASAQYPRFIFRNPLGIPMYLIANFGEIRNDHYHMGLDLRTQQRENLPVYAAAEGYVSRVTVESGGYGNCIYITHPNGYTTLYAHLNKFFPALQSFVEHRQYHDESWEQDIKFPKGQFHVGKGQFIALSGATGAVEGPHLHFEVRDTKTGNNINPLFLGFPIKDQLKPFVYRLYMYDRNFSTYSVDPVVINLKGGKGNYTTQDSVVISPSNKISFGISAEDIANGSGFRFGIYAAELWIDSVQQFSFKLRELNYEDSRYTNAAIDYKKWVDEKNRVQHLSKLPGNKLSIYEGTNNGVIELKDTLVHTVSIIVTDVAANEAVVKYKLQWSPSLYHPTEIKNDTLLVPGKENIVELENIKLHFPSTALYDTVHFKVNQILTGVTGLPVFQIHTATVPLNDFYTVEVTPTGEQNTDKVVMRLTGRSTQIVKPSFTDGKYIGALNRFGVLVLIEDTIPPVISPVGWGDSAVFGASGSISFTVKDGLSTVKMVRAELDSNWLMFEQKGNTYRYRFDGYCSFGKHNLKLIAEDIAGNVATRTYNFELKEKLPAKKPVKKSTKRKHGNTSKRRR